MPQMSGARFIAETLKAYGITHVFYMEAILRRTLVELEKLGIHRVLTHSEKAAAYMADGYARASLKPAICMSQSVGAANLAAGLQDAWLGHSPVVAFTGYKPPKFQYRNAYQEISHNVMFSTVTKYNVKVCNLDQVPWLLTQSFKEATSSTPGPVHIDFLGYEGNFIDEDEAELTPICEPEHTHVPAKRIHPNFMEIEEAIQALKRAQKPVLVVGRGAVVSGAGAELKKFVETINIPIASSLDAKGIISDKHPLNVGPVGTYCRPCANKVISEADLVFFIGCGTGDQVTKDWTLPLQGTKVIQLDINPAELGRNYPGCISILGDARAALEDFNQMLQTFKKNKAWIKQAQEYVKNYLKKVASNCNSNMVPIRPERLCREISSVLPLNALLFADTGYSAIWAGTLIDIVSPDQVFIRASGSLGWAFPASLGAKCALPDRPVVCFTGDGAFWYHLSELETAVRWNIPTVTVINNNSVLGQSQLGVRRAYRGEEGRENEQYRFNDTDFAQLARDFGAFGVRIKKPDDIKTALLDALSSGKPAIIDVVTEAESHPILEI